MSEPIRSSAQRPHRGDDRFGCLLGGEVAHAVERRDVLGRERIAEVGEVGESERGGPRLPRRCAPEAFAMVTASPICSRRTPPSQPAPRPASTGPRATPRWGRVPCSDGGPRGRAPRVDQRQRGRSSAATRSAPGRAGGRGANAPAPTDAARLCGATVIPSTCSRRRCRRSDRPTQGRHRSRSAHRNRARRGWRHGDRAPR